MEHLELGNGPSAATISTATIVVCVAIAVQSHPTTLLTIILGGTHAN